MVFTCRREAFAIVARSSWVSGTRTAPSARHPKERRGHPPPGVGLQQILDHLMERRLLRGELAERPGVLRIAARDRLHGRELEAEEHRLAHRAQRQPARHAEVGQCPEPAPGVGMDR